MTWAKFDDRYHDNRKIKRAWRTEPVSVGLHCMAITYSSMHETDGIIDLDWLEEKLPNAKLRQRVVTTLVDAGLFEPIDGDRFLVHDYLKFNPSSAQLAGKRRRDSERKRQRQPRGVHEESDGTPNGFHAESTRNPRGVQVESSGSPDGASRALPQATPAGDARGPSRPVPSR
jgi:hypothetical protein